MSAASVGPEPSSRPGPALLSRVLSGVVGLAGVIAILLYGGAWGVPALCGVALLICLDEYARMSAPDRPREAFAVLGLLGGAVYAAMLVGLPGAVAPVLTGGTLLLLTWSLLRVPDTAHGALLASRLGVGLLYLPLPFAFIALLYRLEHGVAWMLLIMAAAWLGDTGAYFAGRAFGKTKLFPRVSPKKTVEGAIGGLFAAVAGVCAVKALGIPELPWVHAVILGVILDIAGVTGDLVESMFKRALGVKDSGRIMPGHGGLMDRVDSLLYTAPLAWIYAWLLGLT